MRSMKSIICLASLISFTTVVQAADLSSLFQNAEVAGQRVFERNPLESEGFVFNPEENLENDNGKVDGDEVAVKGEYEENDLLYSGRSVGGGAFTVYRNYVRAENDDEKKKIFADIIRAATRFDDYRFVYSVMNMYGENIVGEADYRGILEDLVLVKRYVGAYSYLADILLKEGDESRGLAMLVEGADRGDDRSRYLLAKFYREGVYVEADRFYAMEWLGRVRDGFYAGKARYELAKLKLDEGDEEAHFKFLVESAEFGYGKACSELIGLYEGKFRRHDTNGEKVWENIECAVDNGYYEYAFRLADYYYNGHLVRQSLERATHYYDKYYEYSMSENRQIEAVDLHKIAVARMRMGNISAIGLFERASAMGNAESSFVMGKILENGSGRKMDLGGALKYYTLAVEQGKLGIRDDINRVRELVGVDKI